MAMYSWNAVRLYHFPRAGTGLQPPSTANPSSPSSAQAPSAVLAAAGHGNDSVLSPCSLRKEQHLEHFGRLLTLRHSH